ncbi:allophanate hydrolase [Polaribacter filamentus]|uniref:Allophanate hydrolase n=1 Tax=Polaribacter filamentus TaxID=53483 RepID=A0A2S7KZ85_9FLAO|nr:5-oxoprolinase subunit PxpB [Polaribacter filamentus]PQB07984.1 allophanate hydrolase [Polaribacter filamentus]
MHIYKPFGAKAILIEWKAIIEEATLKDILEFKDKINSQKSESYLDFSVGYNSLTIIFKDIILDFNQEVEKLKLIYTLNSTIKPVQKFLWEIPVCYDLEFGIDLEEMSKSLNLEISEIIKMHSEGIYTVFFIGFLPGFLYLGGLNSKLFFDRKPNPRLNVEVGSVGIGGEQTGVYPVNSAGGWNIIGKAPISFFDLEASNPCFAKSGDQIKFSAITKKEFLELENVVSKKTYQLFKTVIND